MLSILQQLQPIADKAAIEGRSKPVAPGSRVLRKDIDARVLSPFRRFRLDDEVSAYLH